jgi:hypothetical protein
MPDPSAGGLLLLFFLQDKARKTTQNKKINLFMATKLFGYRRGWG